MNVLHQLRWKLTVRYTLVTVTAFLIVVLILGGIVLTRLFVPNNVVALSGLVEEIRANSTALWDHVLSQSPVDTELVALLLANSNSTITGFDLLSIGDVRFAIRKVGWLRVLVIGADGTLLGKTAQGFASSLKIGRPFDTSEILGVEAPFRAAMAGETDANHLYTVLEPDDRFLLAIPIIHGSAGKARQVAGVFVLIIDSFPTQRDLPSHILAIAGRSLIILFLGVGMLGAVFGIVVANGLVNRFRLLSTAADAWSVGDFSRFIEDNAGDEISQLAGRLNRMARQLQSLLLRRQELAVSEERNRLARDLHDSAKQQALAASFELGAALTLYERDPQSAKEHLIEADTLVDSVRTELTNLVHELRPLSSDGQGFSEVLSEYLLEWSHRCGIDLTVNIDDCDDLSLAVREAVFRIAQEALANIARHSRASRASVNVARRTDLVTMVIKDNGCGFDPNAVHRGLGLHSMQERAEASRGSFVLESVPGQGTEVTVTLPSNDV